LILLVAGASGQVGGGVDGHTAIAFSDTGQDSIQAMARDSAGYIYVAGSTTSADFPVANAAQGRIGSAQLMRSLDRGATWQRLASPPPTAGYPGITPHPVNSQILFANSNNVYGRTSNSAISKSTDGGTTWRPVVTLSGSNTSAVQVTVSPENPSALVADLSTGFSFSTDGGETWATSACLLVECGSEYDRLYADPLNAGGLVTIYPAIAGFLISADFGHSLAKFGPNICCGSAAFLYDPFHAGWQYVVYNLGTQGNLFLSTDGGKTWTAKSASNAFPGTLALAADPDLPGVLYAAGQNGTLYASSDAGTTWAAMGNSGYSVGLAALSRACGPGGGLLGSGGFSPDFGKTWSALPFREVVSVAEGPGCALYAARTMTTDAFVAKLTPDGKQIVWATFLGGNENDAASALAVDGQGNVYVGGTTASADFPGAALSGTAASMGAVFCAKLSGAGQLIFATAFGAESVSGIAVDGAGDAWLAGTATAGFPASPGAFDTQFNSLAGDGYLAKLGPSGALVYGTFTGAGQWPMAIAVDGAGQLVAAGSGGFYGHPAPANAEVGFVFRLSADGSGVTTATNIGGSGDTGKGPRGLAIDAAGAVYVVGNTAATDFATTAGAFVSASRSQPCYTGRLTGYLAAADIFVMKLRGTDFTPIYSALLAGPCGSEPGGIYVDGTGAATFALSSGTTFPLQDAVVASASCPPPYSLTPGAGNGVVARLSADGSEVLFSSYTGACGVPGIAQGAVGAVFAGLNFAGAVDPRARVAEYPVRGVDRVIIRR
jgi:photosystem II stability/assembly factor-like uncharacterized protein